MNTQSNPLDTDLEILGKNVTSLKASFDHLTIAHTENISRQSANRLSLIFGKLNGVVNRVNDWAQRNLDRIWQEKKDQKDLAHQISQMESEGNVPSGIGSRP